ncbi:MAG: exonuclease subunit SbcD [Rothia sp. (in: high G+C Gram-positive bacteria)]|nr:exonuclease subunit SbcD [Rothia sp. (in: high G+C Gram-positive bacteria)]
MRILHTSDWHLGRSFHGFSLHDLTEQFLNELIEVVREENITAVLVSGDVYDQAQPRTETVGLLSYALEELSALGCTVILTSGNHDSAARLGFAAQILARQKVYFYTSLNQLTQPVILEDGEQKVAVYPIPYLEPRAVARELDVAPLPHQVMAAAVEIARADRNARADLSASIVMAHCFATGGQPSESERDLTVGGLKTVSASVFEDFTYAALGHLHGRQKVAENIRYSGSPLAFSFSEEKHHKGAWIIDISAHGTLEYAAYEWKTKLQLVTLKATMDELLDPHNFPEATGAICRIIVTDDVRPLGALEKLRARFEQVAELYFEPTNAPVPDQRNYTQRMQQQRSTQEVCANFFSHVRGSELSAEEHQYLEQTCRKAAERDTAS